MYFRTQAVSLESSRRVLIVGAGSLGQRVRDQMVGADVSLRLTFIGFVDYPFDGQVDSPATLGVPEEIRNVVHTYEISDIVIALPHSAYHQMRGIFRRFAGFPLQV